MLLPPLPAAEAIPPLAAGVPPLPAVAVDPPLAAVAVPLPVSAGPDAPPSAPGCGSAEAPAGDEGVMASVRIVTARSFAAQELASRHTSDDNASLFAPR